MVFKEKQYSFRDGKGITHKRVIIGEFFQHDRRVYQMRNPDTGEAHTGIAEEIDATFFPKKGAVSPKTRKGIKTIDKRLQRSH